MKKTVLPNPDAPRAPIVEKCAGCNKIYDDGTLPIQFCISYAVPASRQRLGCPLQSNREMTKEEIKKVNPLKASKRSKKKSKK